MDCERAEKLIHLYTERKLDGEELEEFLEHVEHCKSCSEELEVNYMIYYALKELDSDDASSAIDDSFDMKLLLKEDIRTAKDYLHREDDHRFLERMIRLTVVIAAIFMIGLCVESMIYGSLENSKFVRFFQQEVTVIEAEITELTQEVETEVETNHKKQVVIKQPETEVFTKPGMIPDEK